MRSTTERLTLVALIATAVGCSPPPAPTSVVTPAPQTPAPVAAPPDAGPPVAPVLQEGAVVISLGGAVEVKHPGSDAWVALKIGDAVVAGDALRTSADGRVELSFSETEIRVHEDSEVELTVLAEREVRVQVRGGTDAQVPGGKVSLEAGGAVATSNGGRLALSFDGQTAIASAISGPASVTQAGKTLPLREGEFTIAAGDGPGKAARIPKKPTVAVRWPSDTVTNRPEVTISGRASAWSRVFVAGKRVPVAADGSFTAQVALKRGTQSILVSAIDPLGQRVVRAQQFVFDPDAPSIKGAVEYR